MVSNLIPGTIADLCRAARDGEGNEAQRLHTLHLPLTRALFTTANPIPELPPVTTAHSALYFFFRSCTL